MLFHGGLSAKERHVWEVRIRETSVWYSRSWIKSSIIGLSLGGVSRKLRVLRFPRGEKNGITGRQRIYFPFKNKPSPGTPKWVR